MIPSELCYPPTWLLMKLWQYIDSLLLSAAILASFSPETGCVVATTTNNVEQSNRGSKVGIVARGGRKR
jgi:hypothetical protein